MTPTAVTAPPTPTSADQLSRERADPSNPRWPGRLLALVVAAFAFLLASFPARNSDLWWHLATGRDVARGRLPFGHPTRPSTGADTSPTWLYDLLCYGVYSLAGETGLVLGKALIVAGVGLILFRLSRRGPGWWVAVTCTVLALLAMSTRLLLQPETVSILLLALTLFILCGRSDPPGRSAPFLPPWQLAVVFAVWVNMDAWFVIGLGVVALVWLGRTLDEPGDRPRNLLRRAVALTLLGAVCLLNPAHVHAFSWPAELSWSGTLVGSAASGLGPAPSPFQRLYLTQIGRTPAGLAYYPLLCLGLLSFVLNAHCWCWQRFLPWLGLAVLSAFQARAVPLFAVLGGPVLAWNLQDLYATYARTYRVERLRGLGPLTAQVLTAVAALALLAFTWPGWLQAPPFEPRRWAVETPPALERSARVVLRWHRDGMLGSHTRALHLSPETASAFAWFCPEDRGVLSTRLAPKEGTPEEWADHMRAAGVTHAVVHHPDRDTLFLALDQFLADPDQWPLLYLEGDVAIFGWRDPARAAAVDPFQGWEVDLDRLAFHPARERVAGRVPPAWEPQSRRFWEAVWKPALPRPIDRDEAALHLLQADALRRSADVRHIRAWEATHAAALVAAAGGWTGPGALLDAQLRLTLLLPPASGGGPGSSSPSPLTRLTLASYYRFAFQQDDTPPAALYLAIRAARRALSVNPDDAQTYLVLGKSYLQLIQSTRERAWVRRMPELYQLRAAQAGAALNQAVALRPDLTHAHQDLVRLYMELGYLDLAAKQLRLYLDRTREAGPPRGVTGEQFRQGLAQFEAELAELVQAVQRQEQEYAQKSSGARVLDRAKLAMSLGLAGKARDTLLASDVSAFGPEGMALELELLTMTGRVRDVREWMAPEQEASLGMQKYRWLRIMAAAATGDYAAADADLAYAAALGSDADSQASRDGMTLAIAKAVLDDRPGEWLSFATLGWRVYGRIEFSRRVRLLVETMNQQADVTTLRGLLALEVGEVEEAWAAFRQALGNWNVDSRSGVDFNGRGIAVDCLDWLASADMER